MSKVTFAVLIGLCALVTYLTRWPPVMLGRRLRPPARISRTFSYIPIGVFAGMVAPAIVWHTATPGTSPDFAFYAAAGVSLGAAVITRKPLWAMLTGVLTIALWHTIL